MWLTHTPQATLICCSYPQRWVEEGHAVAAPEVKARAEQRRRARRPARVRAARHGGPVAARRGLGTADTYALRLCRWTRHFARPASRLPRLGGDLRRVLERPAVRTVFERKGIAAPWVRGRGADRSAAGGAGRAAHSASTAAIASAVRRTLSRLRPAMHSRPERST